ncbi:PspC domain-containing protein [Ruminococcaceae bacterium OttesenSCG-928-A11]|nr:PspC domain-containing protein [Ruminococcaceae bacterium OttesenSCG-928-A11]
MEPKRLYRSRQNRMISGVCGGIAEYFNVDPTIVRLAAVLCLIVGAFIGGVIAYFICSAVIPEAPAA